MQLREGTPGTYHVSIITLDFSLLNSDKYILVDIKPFGLWNQLGHLILG